MSDTYKGDTNKYSVWLSTEPYNSSGNEFIFLCADASLDYTLGYSLTSYNVLGKGTDSTIVVDSATGAIGNISVNGTRPNPIVSTDSDPNAISNADFEEKMRKLLERIQMQGNAYVLRVYRSDWRKTGTPYRDLYVFFYDFSFTFNWQTPNDASVGFSFYRRNRGKGFGI